MSIKMNHIGQLPFHLFKFSPLPSKRLLTREINMKVIQILSCDFFPYFSKPKQKAEGIVSYRSWFIADLSLNGSFFLKITKIKGERGNWTLQLWMLSFTSCSGRKTRTWRDYLAFYWFPKISDPSLISFCEIIS